MNTVQISRGDIVERLNVKPLASGELFVHIAKSASVAENRVYDLVTRSFLKMVEKGDLFVGAGDDTRVYYIGSGGNLKWGGVIFGQNSYAELKNIVKQKPNTLFLYNGTSTSPLYSEPAGSRTSNFRGQKQPEELTTFADGDHKESWEAEINPGDLIFYYPSLDQIIVLPLSRSTDATTRIEMNNLVSAAMTNAFKDVPNVTLQEFLNKPVRHYQYLLDDTGWEPTKATETAGGKHSLSIDNDFDGAIHYVPFDEAYPGVETYNSFTGALADLDGNTLRQGDLILSLPADPAKGEKAGVTHVVVSLYGEMLDQLTIKEGFKRADPYASALWAEADSGSTDGYGSDHIGDAAFAAKYKQVKDFVRRLYETKVDIDPTTGKIISSQLPDFLLGAPKYQGHLNITNTEWADLNTDIDPLHFITGSLSSKFGLDWGNLDGNEDDTSDTNPNNVADSQDVNEKLQSGCYWIYTGDTQDISAFTRLFHLDSNKDDAVTGDNVNTDDNPDVNSDDVAQQLINKGDWIIYNGEEKKFEIIDNSSSFVGILVHSHKVAGVAEFTEGKRTGNYYDRDNLNTPAITNATELQIQASSNLIEFSGPKTVLFKDTDGQSLTSLDYFPVISGDGFASNSRIGLSDDQRTLNIDNLNVEDLGFESLNFTLADIERAESTDVKITTEFINDAFGALKKTTAASYSFQKGEDENSPLTVTTFDFGSVSYFRQYTYGTEPDGDYYYGFDISSNTDKKINLALPTYSGILTTEEYVNRGFTVTKLMIEDAIEYIEQRTSSGNIDWIQTVRYMKDDDGNQILNEEGAPIKEIFDSAIKQDVKTGEFLKLHLHTQLSEGYTENEKNLKNTLSVYNKIEKGEEDASKNAFFGPLDLQLRKVTWNSATGSFDEEPTPSVAYNPSEATGSEKVENILPNHSGVLLNNNSVIDGGVWGVIEDELKKN